MHVSTTAFSSFVVVSAAAAAACVFFTALLLLVCHNFRLTVCFLLCLLLFRRFTMLFLNKLATLLAGASISTRSTLLAGAKLTGTALIAGANMTNTALVAGANMTNTALLLGEDFTSNLLGGDVNISAGTLLAITGATGLISNAVTRVPFVPPGARALATTLSDACEDLGLFHGELVTRCTHELVDTLRYAPEAVRHAQDAVGHVHEASTAAFTAIYDACVDAAITVHGTSVDAYALVSEFSTTTAIPFVQNEVLPFMHDNMAVPFNHYVVIPVEAAWEERVVAPFNLHVVDPFVRPVVLRMTVMGWRIHYSAAPHLQAARHRFLVAFWFPLVAIYMYTNERIRGAYNATVAFLVIIIHFLEVSTNRIRTILHGLVTGVLAMLRFMRATARIFVRFVQAIIPIVQGAYAFIKACFLTIIACLWTSLRRVSVYTAGVFYRTVVASYRATRAERTRTESLKAAIAANGRMVVRDIRDPRAEAFNDFLA
jgi:hypothetical protein